MPLLLALIAALLLSIGPAFAQLGPPADRAISYLNSSSGAAATYVSPQNPLPVTGAGGGGVIVSATASATFPSLAAGPQTLYENLMGQLYIDHPTLDVTGMGGAGGALRVVPATGSLISVSVSPPQDVLAGPTAISSGGTPSLAVNTNGTSATRLNLASSAGLTAIFQCFVNGLPRSAIAFNTVSGFSESSAIGDGDWLFPSAACAQIVVTATAGSATATFEASAGPPVPPLNNFVYLASPATLTDGQVAPFTYQRYADAGFSRYCRTDR